ncbi:NADPH-dependent ferric siderophore reductase [Kineococcus xinjiangensis]|uniref:NADPH-dependent ferric siderophore reductase n=1 Tax=Kineococcus xinjiangensis TaxID=512762 RepID=A0A2S6IUF9_9ACTN|nr:siderophore-interacting protein [Kineococcus xinjiangensis]PPK97910.1 NADPH-dependent ferric siderophore reductase [Kineococcus xinjiangensis]
MSAGDVLRQVAGQVAEAGGRIASAVTGTTGQSTKGGPTRRAVVLRAGRLTPHVVRVVLGGEFDDFEPRFTDSYVKLLFGVPGASYPDPLDMAAVRRDHPREEWPRPRTYTVRAFDAERGELTLDLVVHGDAGLAGPWAAAVRPGDVIHLLGPGGAFTPAPEADWHLLVGDDSALPAIAVILGKLPAGVPARVVVEVEGPEDEQPLPTAADALVRWVHRSAGGGRDALVRAARELPRPEGTPHAFLHGEADAVRQLRRWARLELGVPKELLSASGYWRCGRSDEDWRAEKQDWNRAVELDEQDASAAG